MALSLNFFFSKALEGDGSGWNNFSLGMSLDDSVPLDEGESQKWTLQDKENLKIPINLLKAVKVSWNY